MNALSSSSRRDAMATRASARRRLLEPLTERVSGGAAHGVADLPSPESLPRYLELDGTGAQATALEGVAEAEQDTFSGDEEVAPSPSDGAQDTLSGAEATAPSQLLAGLIRGASLCLPNARPA